MSARRRIEGYAIVSADGMIADSHAIMPDALKNEADQRFFERALDHVDVVVHGRHSHEGQPNSARRRRVTLTRSVARDRARSGQSERRAVEPRRRVVRRSLRGAGARGRPCGDHRRTRRLQPVPRHRL